MEKDIINVDCCIIGGSVAGLWTALELAKRAQKVLVVDKTYIGSEKNNIDLCLNYNCHEKMHKIALEAQKKWIAIKQQNNQDLITDLRGSLSFTLNHQDEKNIEKLLSDQQKLNPELGSFIIKDKQAIKTLLKVREVGEQVKSALVSVEDLALDNQNCLDYLRKELIQHGAKFWGSDEVIDFELDEKEITGLITKESVIKAEKIIIAGGAKSKILLDRLALKMPLRPARSHIIEYTTKVKMPTQILHYQSKTGDYICKPMLNGRNHLIYTGIEDQMQATWSRDVNEQTVSSSVLEMVRIIPDLEYSDIQEVNTLQLAITPDRLPYFGKTKHYKNLYLNIGLHANNYLLAPYLAETLAHIIDKDEKPDYLKDLSPDRFMDKDYKINYKEVASSSETLETLAQSNGFSQAQPSEDPVEENQETEQTEETKE